MVYVVPLLLLLLSPRSLALFYARFHSVLARPTVDSNLNLYVLTTGPCAVLEETVRAASAAAN